MNSTNCRVKSGPVIPHSVNAVPYAPALLSAGVYRPRCRNRGDRMAEAFVMTSPLHDVANTGGGSMADGSRKLKKSPVGLCHTAMPVGAGDIRIGEILIEH